MDELRALADLTAPSTEDGVELLRRSLHDRAERVTDDIRADLLREAFTPGMAAFAAVERFADVVTRSAAARPELHRITSSHRTSVWPDVPAPLDRADARIVAAVRAADELLDITTALAAPTSPGRNR